MASLSKPEKVVQHLKEKKIAIFLINALTRNGREELMEIMTNVYTEFNLKMEFLFNVYSAIVEVIFNGIKANAKYLMFQEEIKSRIEKTEFGHTNDPEELLSTVLQNAALREFLNRFIMPEKIKKQTMNVLRLDEHNRTGKEMSERDKQIVREFRDKLADTEINIYFTIALGASHVVFSVVNDSPIMNRDLQRITTSREIHHRLYSEGRSGEYFTPEYLDTTESAGMGIAMADEVYFELGLDPKDFFTIHTEGEQTRAVLRFPLSLLENEF